MKKFKITISLAWKLLCDICANLIDFIKDIVSSEDFISRHKSSPNDFIRNRLLNFETLIYFFINLPKGSYQDEPDHYFKALTHAEVFERVVSGSALCKARNKLKSEAFVDLNHRVVNYYYQHFKPVKWYGFYLLAVDGSTARVPRTDAVTEHFGTWKPDNGDPCPVARVSQMFDVLSKITIDAIISPKEKGERELAEQHFLKLMPGDLLLPDRGYPAFRMFNLILSSKADFCARISCSEWKAVREFSDSGKKDQIVTITAPYTSIKKCGELGLDTAPLTVRLIRVELETGETEILITSLTDQEKYPHEIFAELYHGRWPVEEDCKTMKCRIELENFTGKSVLSVYQDFHARVFSKNLVTILASPTTDAIDQKYQERTYRYQINFTQVLSKMKDSVILLFNRPVNIVRELITKLHKIFILTVEPIRPGRKFPRNHKIRKKIFNPCYKPIR